MSESMKDKVARLEAQLAAKNAELAAAKAGPIRRITVKVKDGSDGKPATGTVNVFGIRNPYPVSLYPTEWDIIFAHRTDIETACNRARPIAAEHRAKK